MEEGYAFSDKDHEGQKAQVIVFAKYGAPEAAKVCIKIHLFKVQILKNAELIPNSLVLIDTFPPIVS